MQTVACAILCVSVAAAGAQDRTYNVTNADSALLHAVPGSSLTAVLAGKVPGGRVVTTSNQLGAAPTLLLRGAMAMAVSEPIVVIDGVVSPIRSAPT
ncbi:MAG TPA: hypothetical protein VFT29_03500 [Gemmatimonadaceae bacterium]|nr:hypothetical protein [Gemmatimonadaceae bacterium]